MKSVPARVRTNVRSIAALLLLIGSAIGTGFAIREGLVYFRATNGDFSLSNERENILASPFYEALRAVDGGEAPNSRAAIVLLYNSKCTPCKYNMANWAAVIGRAAEMRTGVPVYGVSVEAPEIQRSYWHAFNAKSVRLFQAPGGDRPFTLESLQVVPSTLVIRNGRIVANFQGLLGPARQNRLLEFFQ